MKSKTRQSGFALAFTLVLMALIVIVVVAYLSSTRIERSTSLVYANRLRAKITADDGLAAAIHLLKDNTRYGNYITAMPAPVPTPASIYMEVYRPANPADLNPGVKADDYLRLDNAAGEILVSRAAPSPSPATAGPDARPTPEAVPTPLSASSPFALSTPNPALSASNSYDFNQIVTVGTRTGRLVQPSPSPSPPPAFGQWVNVRNNATPPEVIGRYAFYIEDESMKLNVNVAGNNVGGANTRINDLAVPSTSPAPSTQIEEIDPGAVLPMVSPTPNRTLADTTLTGLGNSGGRLSSRSTLGLLTEWSNTFPDYTHMVTVLSRDDNTTARGWQRLDLNALVAGATSNADKSTVANRIANWIRDAWTGPIAITTLTATQMFNDDRMRKQLAANIVDYIDSDSIPTEMLDNTGLSYSPPIIGIEKIPYIHAIEVIYQASNTTPVPGNSTGSHNVTISMKVRFRFLNIFESDLNLADQIKTITVKGVPAVTKGSGANLSTLLNVASQTFTVTIPQNAPSTVTDLRPVTAIAGVGSLIVPHGTDGNSSSGARSFETDWLVSQNASFTVPAGESTTNRPRLVGGTLNVTVLEKNAERLDVIAVTTNSQLAGYYYGSPSSGSTSFSSRGDFVEDTVETDGTPRSPLPQIASISLTDHITGSTSTAQFGDPRYRGTALTDRWDNDTRTDASCDTSTCGWIATPKKKNRVDEFVDQAEINPRAYAVDWFDYGGNRPLAFIRNGLMVNIGELGNIATCEYPWRTLYLQHPERPVNTTDTPSATDIPLRRSQALDYVLVDLLRAGGTNTRTGAININTQQQYLPVGGTITTLPLESLFVGIRIGLPGATPTPQPLTQAIPQGTPSSADRITSSVNVLVNSTTTPPSGSNFVGTNPLPYRIASVSNKRVALAGETATSDNNPPRPYFQNGELVSTLSRLLAASEASDTTTSSATSNVVYSALRSNPTVRVNPPQNYRKDFEAEQGFREVSNSITTRGNVFRVLYVGQALKNGIIQSEYLGEAFVERQAIFTPDAANADIVRTTDSNYKIIANRIVTE
jgi:hypothetical protein